MSFLPTLSLRWLKTFISRLFRQLSLLARRLKRPIKAERLIDAMQEPVVDGCTIEHTSVSAMNPQNANEAVIGSDPALSQLRRNPKRKSSKSRGPSLDLPDDLLTAAYEPLTNQEREDWEGWVELESDPASFTHILDELGVGGVQPQELFSLDQDSLDLLPKPVYGLIFLFQYQPEPVEEQDIEDDYPVWFANQTSHNACATVALLNIVMNSDNIDLGEKLREFKATSLHLNPPLRGDRITVDSFIRSKHNSFASRLNLLNADLVLDHEVESAHKASKKRAGPQKGRGKALRRGEAYAFHFIAYVEAGGAVWELDGMKPQPNRLGPVGSRDWTTVARPQIEARILQHAESQVAFNLLALCKDPRQSSKQNVIRSIADLQHVRRCMAPHPEFEALVSGEELPLNPTSHEEMAEYGLTSCNFETASISNVVRARLSSPDLKIGDAYDLYQELMSKVKEDMAALKMELKAGPDCEKGSGASKAPWSPAIHRWMMALAEKDALMSMIRNT